MLRQFLYIAMPRKVNNPTPPTSEEEVSSSEHQDSGESYKPSEQGFNNASEKTQERGRPRDRDLGKKRTRRLYYHSVEHRKRLRSPAASQDEPNTPSGAKKQLFTTTFLSDQSTSDLVHPTPKESRKKHSFICIARRKQQPPPRLGTPSPRKKRCTWDKGHKCIFGCRRRYPRIVRHYSGKNHGLTKQEAQRLSRVDLPTKSSKSGRIRKVCPLCGAITCKLTQYLRNPALHHLTPDEIAQYNANAIKHIPRRIQVATPPSKSRKNNSSPSPSPQAGPSGVRPQSRIHRESLSYV